MVGNILDLPLELVHCISREMDYPSLLAMRTVTAPQFCIIFHTSSSYGRMYYALLGLQSHETLGRKISAECCQRTVDKMFENDERG